MLDLTFIQENPQRVKDAIVNKGIKQISSSSIDELLELADQKKYLQQQIEELRQQRNENAAEIEKKSQDQAFRQSTQFKELVKKGKEVKQEITNLESKLGEAETRFMGIMQWIPGVPAEDTPVGPDSSGNVKLREWGTKPKFNFEPKDHVELGLKLGLFDLDRGRKVSGYRGYFLTGEGARLHWAVLSYAMQFLLSTGDFQLVMPTILVKGQALFGSGHFPWGKPEIYQIYNPGKNEDGKDIADPTYLVGTAEVPLMAMHTDETLDLSKKSLKYVGFSPCYRSEVGGYHKDVKGLYRIHEFMKMEQVVICEPDLKQAEALHEEITANAEEFLQSLEIPYQVLCMCTGDMGEPQYKKYDIESWMPGRGSYGETHSSSNMLDFQTRRNNIKVKMKDGSKPYAYSLNNTLVASPRILIAIIENYQQKDGTIKVPKVLQPFMGKEVIG